MEEIQLELERQFQTGHGRNYPFYAFVNLCQSLLLFGNGFDQSGDGFPTAVLTRVRGLFGLFP